ncbi:SGNH/GDSL hydrolase family protein [Parabacteroides pacaensis]|uniref:SGNH/GDSL hydrolase family protein n=1 Tax=Parabacteroides pacaensis TaxID=2086575 RepID=UPI000D0F0842|nr:hypothetical protein [Parabacteroides pacaensis]
MKKMFYLQLCSLLFFIFQVNAQATLSQEKAELAQLKKYEKENPPEESVPMPGPEINENLYGARLTRSATLLETSNPNRRLPVFVLIYGQSITGSKSFTDNMREYLENKYPYANIRLENRSIGGFGGEQLIRPAVHDVYRACPDLIIFHVYGGENHGELETFFSNIRSYTTADIILLNHHINGKDVIKYNESSYDYLHYIANKYNCELVDLTRNWSRYLTENNLNVKDLLRDNTHPNRDGNWLMAQLIGRHIRLNTLFPSDWYKIVRSYYVKNAYDADEENPFSFTGEPWEMVNGVACGKDPKGTLRLSFDGSRVDIVAGVIPKEETKGSARILIDGKPVSKNTSLYTINRPSAGPGTWFPLIRRIEHKASLIPETWTLKVTAVNPDSTVWSFDVQGSETGFDGSGTSDKTFISKSGRVVINADDFMFAKIKNTFKVVATPGFVSSWKVEPLYQEVYSAPEIEDPKKIHKTTIVQGLTNGPHTLEIVPLGDGWVPIEAIEIHRPPLK